MTEPRPALEPLRAALEDFVRWADEWIMAKEQREAYKFTPGEVPPASFAERPHLLNSQLVYLREQGRAVLQASPPPESRAVELLRALVECLSTATPVRGDLAQTLQQARAFLADSAAPQQVEPSEEVRTLIRELAAMKPEDEWYEKFYAAVEALWRVVKGTEIPAQPDPPHVVMARLIGDVAWAAPMEPTDPPAQEE